MKWFAKSPKPARFYSGQGIVEIFQGDLGGGKTLSAMRRAFDVWDAGGVVATNISVDWDNCKKYGRDVRGWVYDDRQYLPILEEHMGEYHAVTPPGALIVLEEVHLFFNAREWQKTNKSCLDFLTQARKYDNDVIFITQHRDNFDKQSRRIIRYYWQFTCLDRSIIPGLGMTSPLPVIVGACYDRDARTLLRVDRWWRDKRLYPCYRTKGLHGSSLARAERPQIEITRFVRPVDPYCRLKVAAAVGGCLGVVWGVL